MLRLTLDVKANAGTRAPEMYPKTLKLSFLGQMIPYRNNFAIMLRKDL